MNVEDLRKLCERLEREGKGKMPVIWEGISHSYDIDPQERTRGGKPVLLVNA